MKSTTVYRTFDPISNLKLHITVKKVSSNLNLPQLKPSNSPAPSGTSQRSSSVRPSNEAAGDYDEFVFGWQEKVFSQRELDHYKTEPSPDDSYLTELYRQRTATYRRPTRWLFSYTDNDGFVPAGRQSLTTSSAGMAERDAAAVDEIQLRNRRNGGTTVKSWSDEPVVRLVDVNEAKATAKRRINVGVEQFFVLIELAVPRVVSTKGAGGKEDGQDVVDSKLEEFLLCQLTYDRSGLLMIKPDFTDGRSPYRLEVGDLAKEVFQYTIENCSDKVPMQLLTREHRLLRELYNRQAEQTAAQVGSQFSVPPIGAGLRLVIFGQLVSASNFDNDGLFVHYVVRLPRGAGVVADADQQDDGQSGRLEREMLRLVGSGLFTQRVYAKFHSDTGKFTAVIGHPFSLDVLLPSVNGLQPPSMMFSVTSVDSWQRCRTEGYGFAHVPLRAGCHRVVVPCWRPLGIRPLAGEMRRFFVGGTPELQDLSFIGGQPPYRLGDRVTRYGIETKATGQLELQLNVMTQRHPSHLKMTAVTSDSADVDDADLGSTLNRDGRAPVEPATLSAGLGGRAQADKVAVLLQEFKRARQRMLNERDGLARALALPSTRRPAHTAGRS